MKTSKEELYKSRAERRIEVQNDGVERITLSFYKYVQIDDPEAMREKLLTAWSEFGCLGRIYIAQEGINAQMNVPKKFWNAFNQHIKSIDEFSNIPFKIAVEQSNGSFYKLTIKVKKKIVADGLDDSSFDPSDTGSYLTAQEMNEFIDDPDAVVIDMRNAYEAEVGYFDGAQIMEVDSFKDQLAQVEDQFKEQKDKKIALYCTGGIRCEKASAWMKHKGFSDVHHVKGGIIDYAHQVQKEGIENKFRGKNFVFDERLGERISDEVVATCHLCQKTPADDHYHCRFQPCHVLFIGCKDCATNKDGYCSRSCQIMDRLPRSIKKAYARKRAIESHSQDFKKNRLHLN